MTEWLILGGWAVPPERLQPLFGDTARYVDINPLMADFVEGDTLLPDWRDRLLDRLGPELESAPSGMAGWSTGAIALLGLVDRLNAKRFRFISVTPSFCRRPGFRHGMRTSAIDTMRKNLQADPEATLASFYAQAGLPHPEKLSLPYSPQQLDAGLLFLKQIDLLPLQPVSVPAECMHGKKDRIIPIEAGRATARALGCGFREFEGGHGFFAG